MIERVVYNTGLRIRNPSLPAYLRFLRESEHWPLERLEQYQLHKCRELLVFAREHSEYYREAFRKASFEPASMSSLEDLKKVPTTTKATLISRNKEIHTNAQYRKLFFSETSGTSGQVLGFWRNEEWDSGHRAAMFRGYSWYGVEPWERNGYFWGYDLAKRNRLRVRFFDHVQNRFRVFSYEENEIKSFAEKLKRASYLHGYSSMIYEVAKIVNRLGIQCQFRLKMIKGTSEKVYEGYQKEVEKAFGKRMINEYGACESGIIAYECPQGSMHVCSENVIVEEEKGEILVTNLLSRSFPIIRYKLGDSIQLADKRFRCPCGREHPVIVDVLGRVGKNVVGKTRIYPSLTFYYVFKNLALSRGIVLNYQAIQNKKGEVELRIEQDAMNILSPLIAELYKYFGDDVEFRINCNQQLHARDGKLKDFITTLA